MDRCAALFRPVTIGGVAIPCRVAMAPMTRRKSPENQAPSEATAAYYARRAAGGVGLIITEGTRFDPLHRADTEDIPAIITDEQEAAWRRVVERLREASGGACRAVMQLWHTGRHGLDPIGPSAVPAPKRGGGWKPVPRAMTEEDMLQVERAMAAGARRALRAGFDGVEIHGAHTYLLDSFLSPAANLRTDGFGGPFENRARFPLRCLRAVRAALGPGALVIYRFSRWSFDPADPGCFRTRDELAWWAGALRDAGADALHVSTPRALEPAFEGGPLTLAGETRAASGLPVIAVGCVDLTRPMGDGDEPEATDPAPAAALVERGEADMLAVGRGLIANPDWCALVRAGRWRDLRPFRRSMLERLE